MNLIMYYLGLGQFALLCIAAAGLIAFGIYRLIFALIGIRKLLRAKEINE
jgi:hypothetical protein